MGTWLRGHFLGVLSSFHLTVLDRIAQTLSDHYLLSKDLAVQCRSMVQPSSPGVDKVSTMHRRP